MRNGEKERFDRHRRRTTDRGLCEGMKLNPDDKGALPAAVGAALLEDYMVSDNRRRLAGIDWEYWGHFGGLTIEQLCALRHGIDPDFLDELKEGRDSLEYVQITQDEFDCLEDMTHEIKAFERLVKSHTGLKFPMSLAEFGLWVSDKGFELPDGFPVADYSESEDEKKLEKELGDAYVVIGSLLKVLKDEGINQEALLQLMVGESAKYKMHRIGERKLKGFFSKGNKGLERRNNE